MAVTCAWEPKKNIYENSSSCWNEELSGGIKQTGQFQLSAVFLSVNNLNLENVVIFSSAS